MNLTSSQEKAVSDSGKNILVSAGAGSGKTGVLKTRVIRKLKKGIHIDELIILTFTEAAASEMKSRIIEAIKDDPNLFAELERVDQAIISTFDAFCLKLVKEYHYLLDLPKNITIGDQIQFLSMQKEQLESTIKQFYLSNDPDFNHMVLAYFQKGDDLLYEIISEFANKLFKEPRYEDILENYGEKYFSDDFLNNHYNACIEIVNQDKAYLKEAYTSYIQCLEGTGEPKLESYISDLKLYINEVLTMDFEALLVHMNSLSQPSKPRFKLEEDIKEALDERQPFIKKLTNDFKLLITSFKFTSKEQALNHVKSTKNNVLKIIEVTKVYMNKLNLAKREKGLYAFQDIMDLATNLLEANPEIQHYYQTKINEIMIDEYQDTNDLQEYFISLISKNNLFMVGDIKQSIYGFRDANPKNFLAKYLDYSKKINGTAIDLRENFRSRKQILHDINLTFNQVMDEAIGGINYQDDQSLIYGLEAYNLEAKNQHYGIDFIKYDLETLKENDETLTSSKIEAALLADDIRLKIDNKYQVLNTDTQKFRDITYSDIAILIDRRVDFERITEILISRGIPVNAETNEAFIESPEMLFLSSYLKFIYCFIDNDFLINHFKALFYSVCRSFVFKVKDEAIINFLINADIKKISDLEILSKYSDFENIYQITVSLSKQINELPVGQLLTLIYQKLDLYKAISYLDNPKKKEEKIDYFANHIGSFEHFSFPDLINYLSLIDENDDWDIQYVHKNSVKDAVLLTTMHKSKGLQFPLVYCPALNKRFNYVENKKFFIFDKAFGLVLNAFDQGFVPTYLRFLKLYKSKQEYISERIRLLYVAFTRAKENLILFAEINDLKENYDVLDGVYIKNRIRLKYNHYTDLLSSTKIRTYTNHNLMTHTNLNKKSLELVDKAQEITQKHFYFQKERLDSLRYSKNEMTLLDDDTLDAITYGNNVHKLLEMFDFNHVNESIKTLPNQISKSITHLLNTEIFDFSKKPNIYQEYEFIDYFENHQKHGIIDLMIVYSDMIYIVDYKLKSISDEAYKNQLLGYKAYIEKITKKPVITYLYSIIDSKLEEINTFSL